MDRYKRTFKRVHDDVRNELFLLLKKSNNFVILIKKMTHVFANRLYEKRRCVFTERTNSIRTDILS